VRCASYEEVPSNRFSSANIPNYLLNKTLCNNYKSIDKVWKKRKRKYLLEMKLRWSCLVQIFLFPSANDNALNRVGSIFRLKMPLAYFDFGFGRFYDNVNHHFQVTTRDSYRILISDKKELYNSFANWMAIFCTSSD